ncbi:YjfB family protein [Samsonia erythrinae]|uniref:Putative motility protein YjfB-like n=1 Tax=Samsonia erythrinae TaxID=160434 RepID=A0A4R3VPE2_9GAMM|nr:YjfB family protein [Samsonia erythrinae]TCV07098.1 putative motility protein YjfB-like [Samsonia erythrinae]
MDVSQIASLATDLSNLRTSNEANTLVMKKSLDNQEALISGILQALPPLPANPSIGRNINTTA